MKRKDLISYLFLYGCVLEREGKKHTVFYNPLTFEFTSPSKGLFKLSDYSSKLKNLGDDLNLPKALATLHDLLL